MPPLYDGPYTVLQHSLCHFRLQMGDKEDNISTLCLNPFTSRSSTLTAARLAVLGAAHYGRATQARQLQPHTLNPNGS